MSYLSRLSRKVDVATNYCKMHQIIKGMLCYFEAKNWSRISQLRESVRKKNIMLQVYYGNSVAICTKTLAYRPYTTFIRCFGHRKWVWL